MPFVVVYDACVLYPNTLRDLQRLRSLMVEGVPDCLVTGYEGLADGLKIQTKMIGTSSRLLCAQERR